MAAPILAVFVDGQPQIITIDQLKELVGVADLQRQLAAYQANAEDRLGAVLDASGKVIRDTRLDVANSFERIDLAETNISAIQDAVVERDAALDLLTSVTVDAAQRQAVRDVGVMNDALLRALMEASRTRDVLRDAGIVVDPTTGTVRIYAIDQVSNRTSSVEQSLDAVNGTLTQKASVNYVNEQIALAVLNPDQVAQLEPIISRLTSAEQEIDGLNAAVTLAASAVELRTLSGTVTNVSNTLDALAGTVSTKADKTVVDQQGIRLAAAEILLAALPDSSSFGVTIRQARGIADGAAESSLRGMLAGDTASRYQLTQVAQVRQELSAQISDGLSAEATARTDLVAQVADANARIVTQAKASVDRDTALSDLITAQGVVLGGQAAAIGQLNTASITAAGGIASATTTIRQQIGKQDQSDDAVLRALIAGDQASQARAAQLVQIQTQFTTTLVANQTASALAQQSLLARMGAAESAIVSTSKVLSDTTEALTTRISALEAAFSDATTGLAATSARIVRLEQATATANQAFTRELDTLQASLIDPTTQQPISGATVSSDRQASVDRDGALSLAISGVSTTVDGQTSQITFLLRAIDGNDAVAQLSVDANGKITGFRINGADSVFAIAADRFVVGNSQVFEIDAETGITTIAYLRAGVITAREIVGSAVQQTIYDVSPSDITIPYG
ncbi:hypothetical protein [uncultured Sphingomonas sp.]|uniref:hypothetical protein n=1 Tax=uncultured Sphingomonas sp. TaxID=158754 RepID=UPI00259690D9|nr:hypothetical protein [uncultured Sphingomonas sp.]